MHYANPNFNLMISAIFLLAIFYLWSIRRRRILMERFADRSLISGIAPNMSRPRKLLKAAMLIIAVLLILVALARPQWGFEWQEVKRSGIDMLMAIDVSKSMLARDVKPNRLERSKYAVKDLLKKLSGDRIGLVAFAGTAFLQCPLTIDYNGFLLTLDDLSTGTIPLPGTSISAAIDEAIKAFSAEGASAMHGIISGLGGKGPEKKYKALVIITDGEELEGNALARAREAEKEGIKIYCVGVGTSDGELIPVVDERGDRGYLSDKKGNTVKTRLNEELLKEVAISTGGNYVRATSSDFGLTLIYERSISKLEKRDIETAMKKNYEERFQIFLAIALALLFMEPMLLERRRAA